MPLIFDSFTEVLSTDELQHLRIPGGSVTLCGKTLTSGDASKWPSCPACRRRRLERMLESWGIGAEGASGPGVTG